MKALEDVRQRAAALGLTIEGEEPPFRIVNAAVVIVVDDLRAVANHLRLLEAWQGVRR